jgi:scyllo-inositol 2-dehydrogenase (NADP+)
MAMFHCGCISTTPGLRLAAGSSRSEQLRAKTGDSFDMRIYDSHEQLLSDPEIEWVVVTTYTSQHREWSLQALRKGKSLIIEKPIALNCLEAEEIFEEAESLDLQVTVFQNRRWDSDFLLVQKILREQILGQVYRIESRFTRFSSGWGGWGAQGMDNPWRLKRRYGGGILLDLGPHLIDQLILLVDSPLKTVFGKAEGCVWSTEVDDHFWAEILFEDGRSARLEASNNHRIPLPRWIIIGTEGTLQIGGVHPQWQNRARIKRETDGFEQEILYDVKKTDMPGDFYRVFSACLHEKRPLPVSRQQVLKTMGLIDAIRESSQLGRSVEPS